jgi:hypothetical protein
MRLEFGHLQVTIDTARSHIGRPADQVFRMLTARAITSAPTASDTAD